MCAALYMTFFGTQPTLTQVPPSAPFSQTATLAPAERRGYRGDGVVSSVDAAFRTMRGRAARRGDAAAAGADDQVVEVPASVASGEFAVPAPA